MGLCASNEASGSNKPIASTHFMTSRLADVFEALDKNKDNEISMGELREFVKKNHIDFSSEELEDAVKNTFELADINHDHAIDADEFCAVFVNVFRQLSYTEEAFENALERKFGKVAPQVFEERGRDVNAVG